MQTNVIKLFAQYNQAANEKMNALIQTLTPEEWTRDLGGYFKSVRGLCSHVYICDFTWIKRFAGIREFNVHRDGFFAAKYSFKDLLFPTKEEYFPKRAELDAKIIDFSNDITDEDCRKILKYTDFRENTLEKKLGGAALHFLNHETHHRGMISLFLEMLGRENDFNSLAPLVH